MRRFALFVGLVFVLAMLTINIPFITPKAHANEQIDVYDQQKNLVKSVVFVVGSDRYFVNNETPGVKMDAQPFIEQGRTFVPIRYLSNALGVGDKHIGWESPKVTLDEPGFPVVELAVGSKTIKSDGQVTTMDVVPQIKWGRTFLPARWVAEALGYQVEWDAENSIVLCYPKGTEKPDVSNVVDYIGGQPIEEQPVEEPVETPAPVVPEGSSKELYDKAKPLDGEPFSFDEWNFDPGIQESLQEGWDWLNVDNPVIQKVNVSDLKPNGIKIGNDSAAIIIHDLKVTTDGVTVTATTAGKSMPHFYLVEEDNVVRYKGGGGYMGSVTGTLTQDVKYIHGRGDSFYISPDLTKVTHILFEFAGELLLVENSLYKGGN